MTVPTPPRHRPSRARRAGLALAAIFALIASVLPASQRPVPLLTSETATPPGSGAVAVPEHPEGTAFNPTQIKDIRAADPGAGVNLIDVPTANNFGDARLNFAIEVPPGRDSVQPQLAVRYSSSGGNGWTGVGWDLPMQSITIDTRWGVPRYDGSLETETYLLNGEQLTPVAHRGALQTRSGEKVFHTRVEGQFRKIVRHGGSPRDYWWEVTDKNGARWFYGGGPDTNGPAENSTLTDDFGNVAVWSLREMRDANGNFMRYHCVRVSDVGVNNGSVPGSNLYLERITYTGHGDTEGPYAVTFTRDRQLAEPRRADVDIDARSGFKMVTADLLRTIEVSLSGNPIRRYELKYRTGAFFKTLLQSISQFGADGQLFTTHELDYFDDIRTANGEYQAFSDATGWSLPGDNLGAGVPDGEASALSASTFQGAGGHLYVGFNPFAPTKSGSFGGKAGFSAGSSEGLLALADVNGDTLPDKVFRTGSGVFYRPNLSGPGGQTRFGDTPIVLTNLPAIHSESTSSGTTGVESYFGIAAQLNHVSTTTRSDRYFADVNGDGITDLVTNGSVLFGHLDASGNPTYSANSNDTPVPIGAGTAGGGIVGDQTAEFERQVDAFPLLDSVRRWVAPYDGTVAISGGVRLIQDTSQERVAYRAADGVRVTIQHENSELWAQRIGPDDYAEFTPSGVEAVQVHRGDRVYFRTQSILDGRFDQVAWNPEITYTGVPAGTDVNGLDHYRYQAARDFTLGGRPSIVTAPVTGTLHLSGDVSKVAPTTDDVTVVITRNDREVFSANLPAATSTTVPIDLNVDVTAGDTLSWKLRVDSPIDLGTLHWVPSAHYIAAEGVPVFDENGNPRLKISPPYDLDMYPVTTLTAPQGFYTATETGQVVVEPNLAFNFGGQEPDTRVVFTVKRRGSPAAKRVIDIVDGRVPSPESSRLTVPVTAGDELFFDYSTVDTTLPALLVTQAVSVSTDGTTFTPVPSALHASAAQGAFPQPYRGWGAIGYQGNRDRATRPIAQAELALDESYRDQIPDAPTEGDVPGFDGRVAQPRAVVFAPMPAQGRWAGNDENTWVAADTMGSSRLGTDTINVARDADFAGATGVSRVASTQQISTTFGASIPGIPIGAGASVARGRSTGQVDFLDLNGDRFPDVVGSAGIQYSDMNGGLGSTRGSLGGDVRESAATAYTVSANAGSPARTASTSDGQAAPPADEGANTARSGTEMPGLGIGGSMGGGEADVAFDLLDINGDGLPDRVFENGTAALNLGYRFAAAEPWPGGPINDGSTANNALSLGFNTDFYGFAGGFSASTGSSKTDASMQDMNGDALLDRVFSRGGEPIAVAINTGNGFAAPTPFRGSLSGINADANAALAGGAYFTFGFCFLFGCVVFNPGADTYTGIGRSELALRDVNGDGYVDHVRSTRDSELVVAENRTGRTNLLRSVKRPLGALIELDYTRDGNTYDNPQSRWVLSKTAIHDGHPDDGQDVQVSTFRYENGRFDRLERDFYGYGRVVTEHRDPGAANAVYRTVTADYRTDSYYTRGLPSRSVTADGTGRAFLETENTYLLRDVDTGAAANPASTTATVFPQQVRVDRRFFEGQAGPGKVTHTDTDYDEFGNAVRAFDAGDVGPADDVESRIGFTATDPACRSRNIVGVPTSIRVAGTATNTVLRQRESTVDCVRGNVTQVRAKLADGTAAVTDLEYFDNGNLRSVIGPSNKTGQRYRLDYGYDTVVGVHVESIVDSFGYRSTATHDLRYGLTATQTDQNNQQLRTVYDSVGRVDSVTGPYEVPENRFTIDFEYHPEAPVPYAVTRHADRTATGVRDDTIDTIQFTDGLKRTLQTKKDASVPPSPGADPQPVMTVSGRTLFDFAGRAVEQFYPVTEPKGAGNTAFNPAFDSVVPTRVSYDVLDRTVRTVLPDNTATTVAYGFGPDRAGVTRFETVTTDANGKQRRTYADTRELTMSVKEFNPAGGQPVIWTSYGYDAMGQITSVVDDRNNTTAVAYDNFGRRTIVDSPDSGRTETRYDLADNMIAKITANLRAKNKAIEYDYDFTRLAGIRYPIFSGNNVRYSYGAPGAPENTADRIKEIHDAAGTLTRGYGPLGEVVRETRRFDDDLDGVADDDDDTFTTLTRFDTWNRTLQLTYPDGERLTYGYDSGGQVTSARGVKGRNNYTYLARMDYDKFEQKVLMDTGTGVRTSYTYDPEDRRLATLRSKLPDGDEFQNLTYRYDNVGNVTSLTNTVPVPHGKPIGGPSTQTFAYDDLYRLTSASGQYRNKDNKLDRYSLAVSYDTIHNTTSKNQRHEIVVESSGHAQEQKDTTYLNRYTYASGKPHAPSKVGPDTDRYDANGNLIDIVSDDDDLLTLAGAAGPLAGPVEPLAGDKRRQLVWDEENRLACTEDHERNDTVPQDPSTCDEHPTVRFVYDDAGNRMLKDGPGQNHISPNRNFSQRNGQSFKHVFVGDTRMVSKRVQNEQVFEQHQFWFHADHLGSASYVTDEDGELAAHNEFFAFGESWAEESPSEPVPVDYQFNGKEFDEETGLYYYGARYYNPRTNLWQSTDPAYSSYLDGKPNGGVYRSANGAPYTYTYNNPVRLVDPDGKTPEQDWLAEYEKAIDDLPARYDARRVLTEPNAYLTELPSVIVGHLADERFCERVGAQACASGAFEFIMSQTTVWAVGAIAVLPPSRAANESAALVKDATERSLSRGWGNVLRTGLDAGEQVRYQAALNSKDWSTARMLAGRALHSVVNTELAAHTMPGPGGQQQPRFTYNASRGPDFHDRLTGTRVELTTFRQYVKHLARGGIYLRSAPHVLYRGPGRMPIVPRGGMR